MKTGEGAFAFGAAKEAVEIVNRELAQRFLGDLLGDLPVG
jgi:hypothetical protein